MNDAPMDEMLSAWLQASVAPVPDARRSATAVLARIDADGRRRSLWSVSTEWAFSPSLRSAATVSGLLVVAAVIGWVAFLPADRNGVSDRPQPAIVGASASPAPAAIEVPGPGPTTRSVVSQGPPIHWRSDEVDLRAEGMTLRIGDDLYTAQGADVTLESTNDGSTSWSLTPSWHERGQLHRLAFHFRAGVSGWRIAEIGLERPDVYGPDGVRYEGSARFESPTGFIPLGQPWSGPLAVATTITLPTCDGPDAETVEVALEFEGLQLEVAPHEPSTLEDLADRWLGPDGPITRALGEPAPERMPRVVDLQCPEPETMPLTLGGLSLDVEPIDGGALRVLGDGGANDLDQVITDVTIGSDGRVLATTTDSLLELGSSVPPFEAGEVMRQVQRVDLMPDGRPLVIGGKRNGLRDTIAVLDGGGWTLLPPYPRFDDLFADDLHDPTWDAAGALWVGVPKGLGRYADDTWDHVSREQYSPVAAAERDGAYGATKSLAADADGSIWVGTGQSISHLEDGVWTEFRPLEPDRTDARGAVPGDSRDLVIGADGTLWSLLYGRQMGSGDSVTLLVRRAEEEWSVFALEDLAPGTIPDSQHILVDDEGAVVLLLRAAEPGPDAARLVRFDGTAMSELARFPTGLGYRLADVGPDGSVWLVGGSSSGRRADRIYVVTGTHRIPAP